MLIKLFSDYLKTSYLVLPLSGVSSEQQSTKECSTSQGYIYNFGERWCQLSVSYV